MAVVAADELDDVFSLGGGAGQANGRHGGFGSGTDEAQFPDGRKRLDDGLGQLDFRRRRSTEAGSFAGRVDDGFNNLGGRMAEQQRAPGTNVVDIRIAVGVVYVGSFAAHQERRFTADRAEGAHRRIHAARDQLFGSLLKFA